MRELTMRNGEVVDAEESNDLRQRLRESSERLRERLGVDTDCSTDDEQPTTHDNTQAHTTTHEEGEDA